MKNHYQTAVDELTAPGSGFAMTEVEVLGNRMRVFESAPGTMREFWESATLHGDKPYLVYEDETYTYNDIAARVRSLARYLVDDCGVESGDRVAVAMRNYPEWVISYWAGVCVGAAVVGMNAWWTSSEMEFALIDSAPKVLICDSERYETAIEVIETVRASQSLKLLVVRYEGDLVEGASHWDSEIDPASAPDALPDADIDPDDDATIFYTSGTTGTPKGAQLTHRGSVHNVMHIVFMTMAASLGSYHAAVAAGEAVEAEEPPPMVIMAPTPLFHVTACNCLLHPATMMGGKLVLTRKWNPARALELIEREKVTSFSGVPTMARELLAHPDWDKTDTSTVGSMGGGGAPVPPDLVGKIDKSLDGGSPTVGYGLTETCGIITANSADFYVDKPTSCGRVVPTVDAKLVDDDGNDLPPGPDVVGQLCVKGPIVIKGYINRPDATAEAIRDGWFNTGDIARIDDEGFVYIVDRAKDMVIRGGENIYCSEVEAAIYEHDAVAEVAVFGVPDDRLGESVVAAVVLHPEASLSEPELAEYLAPSIAKYKIPASCWFREEKLPQNANGKFLKRVVRDEYLAEADTVS